MHRLITCRRKIALTGLYNSGKTVFLTSLLEHLRNHSSDFQFCKDGKLEYFQHIPAVGYDEFPLDECRDNIVQDHQFPSKTNLPSRYQCYVRHSGLRPTFLLDMFDFPGERFSDALMADETYAGWSDSVLNAWGSGRSSGKKDYVAACKQAEGDEAKIITAFRTFLANRVLACQPHISPSSFKLSIDGKTCLTRKPSVEDLLSCGTLVGADSNTEFAPLPEQVREQYPKLADKMEAAFNHYYEEAIDPLFGTLIGCDRLIVLVDIPFLLAAGPDALNDSNKLLASIVASSRHRANWWIDGLTSLANIVLRASWRFGGVTKIAFVATKSDLVVRSDQNRLLALLKQMVAPLRSSLQGIDYNCFTASAVESTQPAGEANTESVGYLTGRPKYDTSGPLPIRRSPTQPAVRYKVSRLPDKWPVRWEPGDYVFPEVYPEMPEAQFSSPPQCNLDRILDFVITEPSPRD